jgi:hypothetical protein
MDDIVLADVEVAVMYLESGGGVSNRRLPKATQLDLYLVCVLRGLVKFVFVL